eukprot:g14111.t1
MLKRKSPGEDSALTASPPGALVAPTTFTLPAKAPSEEASRHLYKLIVSQLQHDGHGDLALSLAKARRVTVDPHISPGTLYDMVLASSSSPASSALQPLSPSSSSLRPLVSSSILDLVRDPTASMPQVSQLSTALPEYVAAYVTTHKNAARCAKFSQDGKFVATGSDDTSIKLMTVAAMQQQGQLKSEKGEDYSGARPVLRTYYDHTGPVLGIDFHPIEPFVASCSTDMTIRFFEHSKQGMKQAYATIHDYHQVRSLNFHPSGDFLISGTSHPIVRLYDVPTLQVYASPSKKDFHQASITCVQFAPGGGVYGSSSEDGSVKLWDTVSAQCTNTIRNAHSGSEVQSVNFSPSGTYLLTGGRDSMGRLWDVRNSGRQVMTYTGAMQKEFTTTFTFTSITGDHVLSSDEPSRSVLAWDTRTGERVATLSGHTGAIRDLAASPSEPAFLTCGMDSRVRLWCAPPEE